jgi:cyclohexa-1,5-dienecarbonyl-CoA hydratase
VSGVRIERIEDGRLARIQLAAGRGNVIDSGVIDALDAAFRELGVDRRIRAVVLCAEGPDFSFGASVAEHRPGEVERMLPRFHALFRTVSWAALPVVAAVRGRCLGGGLELALIAHHLVVAHDARLGLPEITLGVFPPAGAALLPLRVRQPMVDRLVVLGDLLWGDEAVAAGLADDAVDAASVDHVALDHARRFLALSGVSVRFATRAARHAYTQAVCERLEELERTYLTELIRTHDASEGIEAFLAKRPPPAGATRWRSSAATPSSSRTSASSRAA